MLLEDYIKDFEIILASASPRRQNLLLECGINYTLDTSKSVEEEYPNTLAISEIPKYLAKLKAGPFNNLKNNQIVITADTVVILNNAVIGKPNDRNAAVNMLKQLSGNKHTVVTGVCIKDNLCEVCFDAYTDVYFRILTEEEITYYINKYQPFDKAGSYGIQEWIGYVGVEKIDGSFYNVMGLPIQKLYQELSLFISNKI